jgi:septation ring formation regulator EzrA
LAYSSSEKFLKAFVGRKDIEDALQRLERVTVEEARMAAAEALKAVHGAKDEVGGKVDGVQDTLKVVEERMRGFEDMLQGVGDFLQGVDGRVKDIGNKVTTGASTDQLALLLSLLLRLGVEKTGQQMANVDDKVQVVYDTVINKGVHARSAVQDIAIDGAQ